MCKSKGNKSVLRQKNVHTLFFFCGHLGRFAEPADSRKHNLQTLRASSSPGLTRSQQTAVPREALFICAFADLRSAELSGRSSSELKTLKRLRAGRRTFSALLLLL